MSTQAAAILPTSATPLERALVRVAARVLDIETPLRDLWDPERCPEAFLPHLAATLSVDFWSSDWDAAKKRSVIRNAVRYHRIKGTRAGIGAYATLAGAEVLSAIRPPLKFFAGGSDTLEQRRAWLDSLPKVKIYRAPARLVNTPRIVAGGAVRPFFLARRFALASTAEDRARPRALLIRDGIETPVGIRHDADGRRTVILRRKLGRRLAAGHVAGRFALGSTAASTVAPISAETGAGDPALASPLRPAGHGGGILPIHGSDPLPIGRAWFAGAIAQRRFAGVSSARQRIYEQIPLADDLAPPEPRKSTAFAGVTRLAVPAHTAELKTSIPGRGLRCGWFAGVRCSGAHAARVDKRRLAKSFAALRAAKRFSDKILIDTQTYRPFTAGSTHFAGQDIRAGRMTRS